MPAVPSTPRVKLRATSRRVPRTRAAEGEAGAEFDSEPNMRLSRAIFVMLLLHVVAVGGILAFSLIKEKNSAGAPDVAGNASGAVIADDSLVPTTRPVARPESSTGNTKLRLHVVQPGETLLRIASEHGVTVEALVAANGATTAMSALHPGQELRLPDGSPDPSSIVSEHTTLVSNRVEGSTPSASGGNASASASVKAGRLPVDSGKAYTVGKGESPYVIAQKLKVSYEALLKLNRIDDPKKLRPGQKLKIPVQTANKS